jgi:REP element-mobilizing transposase RayT
MSRKYKFKDQAKPYFVSFATVHWIDLFIRPEYAEILLASLRHCQVEKGLEIYGWCIMTSHVHLIIGTTNKDLEDIMRDFKSFTSRKLREEILNHPSESRREWINWMMQRAGQKNGNNKDWQLWQQNNKPIELSDLAITNQKLTYVHMNPVLAGFVSEPHLWRYSSAIDYAGGKGLLDIKVIE